MKKIIYLNSGHSHLDSGAMTRYGAERDLNIAITDFLVPELERQGLKVEYIPDELNLTKSIDWVNKKVTYINDGLALSIHNNCCGGQGAESYYFGYDSKSKAIAKKLVDEFCKETGLKNRGAKSDITTRFGQLSWIRRTNIWATLIECGFMDNSIDMKFIIENLDKTAKAICKGVCEIYNIAYVEKKQPSPTGREEVKKEIKRLVDLL